MTTCGSHGRGRRYAVLREDRIHVGIRADGERHLQRHAAVVRVGRLHVDHVAHAVDAFFERRGDALFDRQRVGSEILGRYLDHGRGDVRILLDRHAPYGDQSEHDDHNGYDHREDRTSDEDISHIFQCFTVESAVGSGSTTAPSRSLWNPEVTIRSSAFTPEVTIRRSAVRPSERDDPLPCAVVFVEHVDAIYVLRLDDGRLWNQERSVNRVGHDLDPGELSRPEPACRDWET